MSRRPRRVRPVQVLFILTVATVSIFAYLEQRREPFDPETVFGALADESPDFEELRPPVGELELSGTVESAGGEPAGDVQVFLYRNAEDRVGAEPLHLTTTDAAGRFRLGQLMQDTYGVILYAAGSPPRTLEVTVPVTEDVHWQLNPELEPLPSLPEMRRADLEGHVVSSRPGLGTGGYELWLRPAEGTHPLSGAVERRTFSDADGRFRFEDAVAVEYQLTLLPAWATGGSWPVLDRLTLVHSPDTDFAPILELRVSQMVGRLTTPDGLPIEGALVLTWPVEAPNRLWPPTSSAADGTFEVPDLPVGRYRVRMHAGLAVHEEEVQVHADTRVELGSVQLLPMGEVGGDIGSEVEAGAPTGLEPGQGG